MAKALREHMGQAPATSIVEQTQATRAIQTKAEASSDPLVNFIKRVLTRSALAPRNMQLVRTLYEAGDAGMMRPDLVKALNITTNEGIKGVVGPFGPRVASTLEHDEVVAADREHHSASGLLLKSQRIDNNTH